MGDLFDRSGPGESEAEEDNEEERAPQIPIPQGLARVFTEGVGEDNELQITDNPGQISLDGVPHGLGERVGRGASERSVCTVYASCEATLTCESARASG